MSGSFIIHLSIYILIINHALLCLTSRIGERDPTPPPAGSSDTDNQPLLDLMTEVSTTPPTPVPYIISITSVNITWMTTPDSPPIIVQCRSTDFSDSNFHNISQPLNSSYFVFSRMKLPSYYVFQLVFIQNNTISDPGSPSDIYINGGTAPAGPPIDLSIDTVTTSSIKLTWDNPLPKIDRTHTYHLFKGDSPSDLQEVDHVDSVNYYIFDHLSPATLYYFAVQSDIGGIKSVLSSIVNQSTTAVPMDLPPLTISIANITYTSIEVTWDRINLTAGHHFGKYLIYYAVQSPYTDSNPSNLTNYVTINITDPEITSHTVTGLEEGVLYLFKCQYVIDGSYSDLSNNMIAQTLSSVSCVSCFGVSSTEVHVEWEVNPRLPLTTYIVFSHNCTNSTLSSANSSLSLVLHNNTAWTQCSYYVAAMTHYGYHSQLSPCPPAQCITYQTNPSAPPSNFTGISLTPTSVTLSWDPIPYQYQNGPIIQYIISCIGCPQDVYSCTSSPFIVHNLSSNSSYIFHARGLNKIGLSPSAPSVVVQTLQEKSQIGTPNDVTTLTINYTSVSLKWYSPTTAQRVTMYTIEYTSDYRTPRYVNTTDTYVLLNQLQPNTNYSIRIQAWIHSVYGPYSHPIYVSTLSYLSPVIDHFMAVTTGQSNHCWFIIEILWKFNENPLPIHSRLSYSSLNKTEWMIINPRGGSVNLTSDQLSYNTNYTFYLEATIIIDNDGDGDGLSLSTNRTIYYITPDECTGVTTLEIVALVFIGALLIILCTFVTICLVWCFCFKCLKRRRDESHNYSVSHHYTHRMAAIPNEYMTVMRDHRGDGESLSSSSQNEDPPITTSMTHHTNSSSESPPLSRVPWFHSMTLGQNPDDYLTLPPQIISGVNTLPNRLVPDGSSLSSSLISLSSAPP